MSFFRLSRDSSFQSSDTLSPLLEDVVTTTSSRRGGTAINNITASARTLRYGSDYSSTVSVLSDLDERDESVAVPIQNAAPIQLGYDDPSFVFIDSFQKGPPPTARSSHYNFSAPWDAVYHHKLGSVIGVDDILLAIFCFIEVDLPTLLSISTVSHAWRERINYLPHWQVINNHLFPMNRLSKRRQNALYRLGFRQQTLSIASRESFMLMRVAEGAPIEDPRAAPSFRWRQIVILYAIVCVTSVSALTCGWYVGYSSSLKNIFAILGCGAAIGASFGLLMIGALGMKRIVQPFRPIHVWRRVRYGMLASLVVFGWVMLVGVPCLAYIGAHVQSLDALAFDHPTYTAGCPLAYNTGGAIPSQLFIQNVTQWQLNSTNVTEALNGQLLVAFVESSFVPSFNVNGQTVPCWNFTSSIFAIALPLSFNASSSALPWPPSQSTQESVFLPGPVTTRFYTAMPRAEIARPWYNSEAWTKERIPLVSMTPHEDFRAERRHFEHYVTLAKIVLVCIMVPLLLLPIVPIRNLGKRAFFAILSLSMGAIGFSALGLVIIIAFYDRVM